MSDRAIWHQRHHRHYGVNIRGKLYFCPLSISSFQFLSSICVPLLISNPIPTDLPYLWWQQSLGGCLWVSVSAGSITGHRTFWWEPSFNSGNNISRTPWGVLRHEHFQTGNIKIPLTKLHLLFWLWIRQVRIQITEILIIQISMVKRTWALQPDYWSKKMNHHKYKSPTVLAKWQRTSTNGYHQCRIQYSLYWQFIKYIYIIICKYTSSLS